MEETQNEKKITDIAMFNDNLDINHKCKKFRDLQESYRENKKKNGDNIVDLLVYRLAFENFLRFLFSLK